MSEGGARTFSAAVAAAAAGVGTKNAVSFLVLTSGGDRSRGLEAFLMPFGLGTLICVALGQRPAPGRRPPLRPLTPAIEKLGEWPPRRPHQTQKKTVAGLLCTKQMTVPCEAHLKINHNGTL